VRLTAVVMPTIARASATTPATRAAVFRFSPVPAGAVGRVRQTALSWLCR
jgi:hypothetical protein